MKILAIPASTSSKSINRQLVSHAANVLASMAPGSEVEVIDLFDYDMPIYRTDLEAEIGVPEAAKELKEKIGAADALLISFAEHNSNYAVAWKNTYDWMSRLEGKLYQQVPMVFMATSPGARGGASVLSVAEARAPFDGGNLKASFSLPSFQDNFADGAISNPELAEALKEALSTLL